MDPASGAGVCSVACDCQAAVAPAPRPANGGGSLPNPQPPGFDGFWRQVRAKAGQPVLKYKPFPSGLVNTETQFYVADETPRFAPSEAGDTMGIGNWQNPTGDPNVRWQNYRLSIHWRLDVDQPFAWSFADGTSPALGGFGQAAVVKHRYEQSSYGQPVNGPHDPKTTDKYPGATPAFQVTVTSIWLAEFQTDYDEVRTVDDSYCVAPGSLGATDHSDSCAGAGPNHHSGTREVVSHVGPSGWQLIDLRLLGHPTSYFEQTTTLPTSVLQIQSILTR